MNSNELITIINAIESVSRISLELYKAFQSSKTVDVSNIDLDVELETQRIIKEMAQLRISANKTLDVAESIRRFDSTIGTNQA